jgi:succinate dehydrogenase/fumarate reductase iron-sulfur protein
MTILEALMHVYENSHPVAFDYNCHGRDCGRCAMLYDSKPVLACVEPISDGNHTLEPLPGYPVLRDLIVDKSQALKNLATTYNRVRVGQLTREEIYTFDMSAQKHLDGIEWCCRCQNCTTNCPAVQTNPLYVGPSRMTAIAYRFLDPYDQADRILEAVQGGLWSCIMCGKCDDVCNAPEIHHLELWELLRNEAEKRGFTAVAQKQTDAQAAKDQSGY